MSVQVFCPKCDRSCRIKEDFLGKRVRCPGCQEIFKAEEVPVADFDDQGTEVMPEFTPPTPFPKVPDVDPQPLVPRNEEDRLQRSRDDEETRRRKSKDEDSRESKKTKKTEPHGIEVGKVENPFDEKSHLAESAAAVDQSLFEFDYGDEPLKKKEKRKGEDEEDDRPRKSRRRDEDDRDQVTKIDDDSDIEDRSLRKKRTESESSPALRRSSADLTGNQSAAKKSTGNLEPEQGSVFSFGDAPAPSSKRPPSKHDLDDDEADEPPAHRREPKKNPQVNDDADFLGLQNMDAEPAAEPAKAKPRPKQGRRFFHARQSALLGESRLYRVFVQEEGLVFVTVATGKEISAVEEALATESFDDLDRRLRNKLADLADLSVDELCEGDRQSLRFASGKIVSAAIDPPGRKLLRKTGAGSLVLEHKSKGSISFDLPDNEDVRNAIDHLPSLIDDVLEINVRWDKSAESYIRR